MPPRAIIQQDLSKGTNLVTNPYDLGRQQSIRMLNLILDEHGSARTRPGTQIITTAPTAGLRIVRVYDLVLQNGVVFETAILRGNTAVGVPTNALYLRSTDPWTLIGNFTTIEDVPDAFTFVDNMIIAAGYETPRAYNGVSFTPLPGGLPGAKHMTAHLGSA